MKYYLNYKADSNKSYEMSTKNSNAICNWLMNSNISNMSLFWSVFSAVFIPVTIPWLIFKGIWFYNYTRRSSSLQGKVVLITGASSGLGEALAHSFYKKGCRVVLAARRKEELERVKSDLLAINMKNEVHHPPVVVTLDLTDLNELPKHVEHILEIHGQIDVLVNNGGVSHRGSVVETKIDVDIRVMLVNYFGQVALTKAVLPRMLQRGAGHIVAVSSVQGRIALPQRSAYAASKHALQAFCDSLRAEVQGRGVQVTVVNPGYIKTELSLNALKGDGAQYGVMDPTTENGYSAEYVAQQIIRAVIMETREVNVAPLGPRLVILLRTLLPWLYFVIMSRRANKQSRST